MSGNSNKNHKDSILPLHQKHSQQQQQQPVTRKATTPSSTRTKRGANSSEFTFRSPFPEFIQQSSSLSLPQPSSTSSSFSLLLTRSHQQQKQQLQNQNQLEYIGTALLPSLARRTTIAERKKQQQQQQQQQQQLRTPLRIGSTKHTTVSSPPPMKKSNTNSSKEEESAQNSISADWQSIDPAQVVPTPTSPQNQYAPPSDNENDGQYVSEFWLNALVPKPHTNFFGYVSSIGHICISISTRESHGCYKALVRTPFKFSVVYVDIAVIDQPIAGNDLDRLLNPTPQKILLYHALKEYFEHTDIERSTNIMNSFRNTRLLTQSFDRRQLQHPADLLWGRDNINTSTDSHSLLEDAKALSDNWNSSPMTDKEEEELRGEIKEFLEMEREARDLATATEGLNEIRDEPLKPLLRKLEPKLYRRRLKIDFVVVGARDHSHLLDMSAPHRKFLRTLERTTNARVRGILDKAEAIDSPQTADTSSRQFPDKNKETDSKTSSHTPPTHDKGPQQTQKGKEKRNNIILELIATERSYVEKLRILIDIYVVPLRSAARSANNALIPSYDAHVIFSNIERINEVNEQFLDDLEAWHKGVMDSSETVGSLCRDHFVGFHVYKRYINGYHHALVTSRELEAKNQLYSSFLQRSREREECRKLTINDLLILPVQRIPHYTLLLTDLLKATPEDDPDKARIRLALEHINEIGQLADNQIAESLVELHNIQTTVEGCPPNLISASRGFIGGIDVSEIDLVTSASKKPMSLLVFSDLLMIVERFWPPRDRSGIRITGNATTTYKPCPIHGTISSASADPGGKPGGLLSSSSSTYSNRTGTSNGTSPLVAFSSFPNMANTSNSASPLSKQQQQQEKQKQKQKQIQSPQSLCICGGGQTSSSVASSPSANAFMSASSGNGISRKKWGRFAGWVDITRANMLEKSASPSSRVFYIHRCPATTNPATAASVDTSAGNNNNSSSSNFANSRRTVTEGNSNPTKTPNSSIISLDTDTQSTVNNGPSSPASYFADSQKYPQRPSGSSERLVFQKFAQILYPNESTSESYGDPGYWYPQSLHEFEADHPLTRDSFFEFLNTAWDRAVARYFVDASSSISRHGSNAGANGNHRKTKSGVDSIALNGQATRSSPGHPELDRVDVAGQTWTVRIWDSDDYISSRQSCPSALEADMTVVWDYQNMVSPGKLVLLDNSLQQNSLRQTQETYFPLRACRIAALGDDCFQVTSTILPSGSKSSDDTYASLAEDKQVANTWGSMCQMVENAIVMYQYVLLTYPEHRRIQQCYNRSILASFFGQNALGSSSSVKAETAASATPRKLFSRARHLFSSGKNRSSGSPREMVSASNLFTSAFSNAVASDTVGPSASPPSTVLGRYKLKNKAAVGTTTTKSSAKQQESGGEDQSPTTPTRKPSKSVTLDAAEDNNSIFPSPVASRRKPGTFAAYGTDTSADLYSGSSRKVEYNVDSLPSFPILPDVIGKAELQASRPQTSWGQLNRSISNSTAPLGSPSADRVDKGLTSPRSSDAMLNLRKSVTKLNDNVRSHSDLSMKPSQRPRSQTLVLTMTDTEMDLSAERHTVTIVNQDKVGTNKRGQMANEEENASLPEFHTNSLQRKSISDFPDDFRYELDQAINNIDSTPPQSIYNGSTVTSDSGFISGGGLNVVIPTSKQQYVGVDSRTTWDTKSPDVEDVSKVVFAATNDSTLQKSQASISSTGTATSSGMMTGSTFSYGAPPKAGLSRRQGVYGAPPYTSTKYSNGESAAVQDQQPLQTMFSGPKFLQNITREFEEGEPYSSLYIDDATLAHHMQHMSMAQRSPQMPSSPQTKMDTSYSFSVPGGGEDDQSTSPVNVQQQSDSSPRPLPFLPTHSKSVHVSGTAKHQHSLALERSSTVVSVSGNVSKIPQSPTNMYNPQGQQQQQQQSTQSPSSYRRLPTLPPRVRSTAASSYISDRNSSYFSYSGSGPTSPN